MFVFDNWHAALWNLTSMFWILQLLLLDYGFVSWHFEFLSEVTKISWLILVCEEFACSEVWLYGDRTIRMSYSFCNWDLNSLRSFLLWNLLTLLSLISYTRLAIFSFDLKFSFALSGIWYWRLCISDWVVCMFDWLQLISRIWSDKRDLLIEATTQIRTLLCGGERHPINLFF